jgi:UDP-N-acetylglucosamine 2-epimerase (non-hydrolysing)
VLLAACLGGHEAVTSGLVRQMAVELQQEMVLPLAELPEAEPEPAPEPVAPVPPEPVSASAPAATGQAATTPGAQGADGLPGTPDHTASAQEPAFRFDAPARPVRDRGDDSPARARDRAEPGSGAPTAAAAALAPHGAPTPASTPGVWAQTVPQTVPAMPPIMPVTDGVEFDIDLDEVDGPTQPPASPSSPPEWANLDLELEPAFAPAPPQDAEPLPIAAPLSRRDTLVLLHGDRPDDEPLPASGRPTLLALGDSALACAKLRRLSLCWQQAGQTVPVRVLFAGSTAEWSAQGASAGADRAELAPDACVAASERADPTSPWRRLLQDGTAHAVVVAGASWPLLHAALTARQAGVPVVRLGAGESRVDADSERSLLNTLLDRAASWLCCTGVAEHQVLIREGVPARRIARVGNLAAGVLQGLAPSVPEFPAVLGGLQLPALWLARAASGFGLVTAQVRPGDIEPEDALQWLMLARLGHAEMPLLWLADEATLAALRDPTLQLQVESSGIAIVAQLSYVGQLSLLSRARCVLAGPAGALADEAGALGVPVVLVQLSGGSGMALKGGGLTLVGPSAAQLRAAVRAAHQQHRAAGALLELDDDAATETAQQLARWLGPAGSSVVGPEEAVA